MPAASKSGLTSSAGGRGASLPLRDGAAGSSRPYLDGRSNCRRSPTNSATSPTLSTCRTKPVGGSVPTPAVVPPRPLPPRKPEVELPPLQIHAHHLDLHLVAEPVAVPVTAAFEQVTFRVEVVVVVPQAADVHEPLGRELLALREEAEFDHARNHRVHHQTEPVAQVGQEAQLDRLALGRLGPPLRLRAMLGDVTQLLLVGLRLSAGEPLAEQPVDGQVRVPADRRSEMTVVVAGQGEVLVLLCGVNRLPQAAEHGVVDRVALRPAGAVAEDALEVEPAQPTR